MYIHTYKHVRTYIHTYIHISVFPPKGGTMELPLSLFLLPHPSILKLILKPLFCTLLTKHWVPLMHSSTLNIILWETLYI